MRFTTKTEYGLICLVYMAQHEGLKPVTAKEIVIGEEYSTAFIEKILQKLRKANIIKAFHGFQGGYSLARDPSEITFKDIVIALEGATFEVFCEPENREKIVCTHFPACGVKSIWHQTKEVLDTFFESITLKTILERSVAPRDIKKMMVS